jgi:PAS domain S-box-containing protein
LLNAASKVSAPFAKAWTIDLASDCEEQKSRSNVRTDGAGDVELRNARGIALSKSSKTRVHGDAFLNGGGEMGALMRVHDWSASSLGEPNSWPQALRTVVRLILNCGHPMYIWWGPTGACLYNDAYCQSIGPERHPGSIGRPAREVWDEIWDIIGPQIDQVMAGRGATWHENALVPITRNGKREDVYWTYSYSPIDDDTAPNGVGGVLVVCAETTQAVLANQRSEAERQRQLQLLTQMPGFVGVLSGPEHIYEYVNDAYVAISGPRNFIGRSVREVFPELEGQGFYELLDQVYLSGERYVAQGMPIRLTGEAADRFIDLLYEPIRDDQQQVTGIFVGGYDATEAHRTAAALRELNANLERQVLERSHIGGRTWQVSPDLLGALNSHGYFETSNPAWQTVLGWSEAEVASMSIWELLHPDDLERTRGGFQLTQEGQPAIGFPNRYRRKDGSYRWISWVGVPVDGLVYCSGRDITQEKAAEEERDQLWALSEDMLARADYGGVLSAVNPAWTQVLGWSEQELLTNPYADIIHPDNVPLMVAALQAMRETGQPTRFENKILAKNGEWKPIGWTVSPEPDDVNFIAVGRDLSEYKARERELMEAQEALRQSQKMEAVGQLTGGIAHDFNNLLAAITGSLSLIERRLADGKPGIDRYIGGARDAALRAAALTQRLLAFSRRQTLDPTPIDANKLVGGMEELIRRTVGPNIDVEVVGAGGLWAARVDRSQLENSLLNLCINARDAMAPAGGRLTIETANRWLDARAAKERDVPPDSMFHSASPTPARACRRMLSRALSIRSSRPSQSGKAPDLGFP